MFARLLAMLVGKPEPEPETVLRELTAEPESEPVAERESAPVAVEPAAESAPGARRRGREAPSLCGRAGQRRDGAGRGARQPGSGAPPSVFAGLIAQRILTLSRRTAQPCRSRVPAAAGGARVDSRAAMRDKAPETYEEKLAQLEELRYEAVHAGSEAAVEKQHAKGKYTARERIEKLLDPGSFQELDAFVRHRTIDFDMEKNRPYGDAVVTGHGTIDGRRVCVFSQDFTVFGGSLGEVMARRCARSWIWRRRSAAP